VTLKYDKIITVLHFVQYVLWSTWSILLFSVPQHIISHSIVGNGAIFEDGGHLEKDKNSGGQLFIFNI
jgi:hypothetical protein